MPTTEQQTNQLNQLLLRDQLVGPADLERLQAQANKEHRELEEILLEARVVSPHELARVEAELFNIAVVDLTKRVVAKEILNIIPIELTQNYQVIAYDEDGDTLYVATVFPGNAKAREAVDFLARLRNKKVVYAVTTPDGITKLTQQQATLGTEIQSALGEAIGGDAQALEREAPIAKIMSVIFKHAVEGRASDIHIEPLNDELRVRYRVDGVLHTSLQLPKYLATSVVARLKVLANLKLDESRTPQDGRIRQELDGHTYDFRVSILPVMEGEKIVIRILETSRGAPALEELGFLWRELDVIQRQIRQPNGMLLVVGPTGSGKSTTLFSIMHILNKEGVNIATLEDPVEYSIAGVNQAQVRPEVGFTFATGLRSLLRQDPNIIMVGEIRDGETAGLAVQAGLTGHLVLSTLHTNDALGVVPRLKDMGVEPFLLASTLNAVVAQRLVRRICQQCSEAIGAPPEFEEELLPELQAVPEEALAAYALERPQRPLKFFKGRGCAACGQSGYKGRMSIAEVLEVTPAMRTIIQEGFAPERVQAELKSQKFLTLRQNGIIRALAGATTIEEVLLATREH